MSGKKKQLDLSKDVMKQIKSDDIQMKSKNYFILLSGLLISSTILVVLLTSVFLTAFVYDVQIGGELNVYRDAGPAEDVSISHFPWGLLFVTSGFLAITVMLARRHEWGYKHRMISIVSVSVGIVIASSMLLTIAGTSDNIANFKPVRPFTGYGKYVEKNVVAGEVIFINEEENAVIIENKKGRKVEINVEDFALKKQLWMEEGDFVHIFIEHDGDVIKAKSYDVDPPHTKIKDAHDLRLNFEINRKRAL